MKDDAIVLVEAREIMQSLPPESQNDKELAMAIIGSLQSGLDKHDVQIKANEIAVQRLEAKVDKGFQLVNNELIQVKQQVRENEIHRSYMQKNVENLTTGLSQAYSRIHEATVNSAVAIAKAEGAKDVAKNSRWANFDPLTGMTLCAVGIIAIMTVMTLAQPRLIREEPKGSTIKCGVDVQCSYDNRPNVQPVIPTRGGV